MKNLILIATALLLTIFIAVIPHTQAQIIEELYQRPNGQIGCIAVTPQGQILFTNFPHKPPAIYTLTENNTREQPLYKPPTNYVIYGLDVDENGNIYYTIPQLHEIHRYNPKTGEDTVIFKRPDGPAHAVAIAPNGTIYFTESPIEGYSTIYKITSSTTYKKVLQLPHGAIFDIKFNKKGDLYYTDGRTIYLIKRSGKTAPAFTSESIPWRTVNSFDFASNNTIYIVSAYSLSWVYPTRTSIGWTDPKYAGKIYVVYLAETPNIIQLHERPSGQIGCITISRQGIIYYTNHPHTPGIIYKLEENSTENPIYRYPTYYRNIYGIAIDNQGIIYFTVPHDRKIYMFNPKTGKTIPLFTHPDGRPYAVAVDPNGDLYFTDISEASNTIYKALAANQYEEAYTTPTGPICDIKFDEKGNLYYTDGYEIYRLQGSQAQAILDSQSKPWKKIRGFTILPNGTIYLTDTANPGHIYRVNPILILKIVDADGNSLPKANITVKGPYNTTLTTDNQGLAQLANIPWGKYNITATWKNTATTITTKLNTIQATQTIKLPLYTLTVNTLDSQGNPTKTKIKLTTPTGKTTTHKPPLTIKHLPKGTYTIEILHHNKPLKTVKLTLNKTTTLNITLPLHTLTVNTLTPKGQPAKNIKIHLTHPNGTTATYTPPLNLQNLPEGSYTIEIAKQGTTLKTVEVQLTKPTTLNITLPLYTLTATPTYNNTPVKQAQIALTHPNGTTTIHNTTLHLTELPQGTYTLQALLHGIPISKKQAITLNKDTNTTIPCTIKTLTITVTDPLGTPLNAQAQITFSNNETITTTIQNGKTAIILPATQATLTIKYGDHTTTLQIPPQQTQAKITIPWTTKTLTLAAITLLAATIAGLLITPQTRQPTINTLKRIATTARKYSPIEFTTPEKAALDKYLKHLQQHGIEIIQISTPEKQHPQLPTPHIENLKTLAVLLAKNTILQPPEHEIHLVTYKEQPTLTDWQTLAQAAKQLQQHGTPVRGVIICTQANPEEPLTTSQAYQVKLSYTTE